MKFAVKAKAGVAEISIYDDIGESLWSGGLTPKAFAETLATVRDAQHLRVFINSYGGSVFDGIAIYNQLRRHGAAVKETVIDGIAASIASVIAMAGDSIAIAPNGWLMVHQAWGMAVGNAAEMRDVADRLDALTGTIIDTYVARRRLDRAAVADAVAAETWLTGDDAVAQGWADRLTEPAKLAACADPRRFRCLPAALAPKPNDIAARQAARLAAAHLRAGSARRRVNRPA